ncbi:tudor domain-containing 6-like [Anopheles maculipalpis]|uniref:tudor domain-containing 6-like n=1 Tax=Anopheles maculipalpis TaxID=1496333 RepID=UPI002159026B|nr:tudor domain-containing 6-like [Anopheles maculipalpis]
MIASVLAAPSFTIPAMDCASCKRQGANLVCSTCGTFYCSVPCQAKHWPTHRYFCMPRLVMATPLLGTAAYVESNMTSSTPEPPNMMAKSCNQEAMLSSSPNVKHNSNFINRENGNGTTNKQYHSLNNGRRGSSPHAVVAANDASKRNVTSNAKKMQQKLDNILIEAKNTNARLSSTERTTEVKTEVMLVSGATTTKANVDNCGRKDVDTKEKKLVEKLVSNTALPKTNTVKDVQKAECPTMKKQTQKPVAAGLKEANTKIVNSQSIIRSANVNDQKPDNTSMSSQHLQHAPFPDPGSKMMISYVADDMLYIYETGTGPNGDPNSFEVLIARSIECSRTVQSYISTPPIVGDIVFAAYDGDYYRAVVKSISNATVEVLFPDFGNSQTVQWNTLKEIPDPKIKYANCLTHPVWIQNVPSFTITMKKFLNQHVDVTEFMLHTVIDVPNTSTKMVEMYQCSDQYYLSVKLQNISLQADSSAIAKKKVDVQPKSPQHTSKYVITNANTYKPVYIEELIDVKTIEGKGIELVIINASESQLSVVTKTNFALYKAMLKDSDVYGKIDPNPYEPKENEVCLVKRDGIWYRAVTLQVVDDEANFYLLDEQQFIGSNDIEVRRYPPGLTRQQFVVECVVENTNVLLNAMGGSETNAHELSGCFMTADVYQSPADEDTYETTHLTILSICK